MLTSDSVTHAMPHLPIKYTTVWVLMKSEQVVMGRVIQNHGSRIESALIEHLLDFRLQSPQAPYLVADIQVFSLGVFI